MELLTERLTLILPSTEEVPARIESMSPADQAEVSPEWVARLRAATEEDPWTHGFNVVRRTGRAVIGNCGYKGPPDRDGVVEIAYGSTPSTSDLAMRRKQPEPR